MSHRIEHETVLTPDSIEVIDIVDHPRDVRIAEIWNDANESAVAAM